MSLNHTLSNPSADEMDRIVEEEVPTISRLPVRSSTVPSQMSLNLPRVDRLSRLQQQIKVFLRQRETEMEIMPFWRDLAAPLAFVSSTLLILILFVYGLIHFNDIPPRIQFYYDAIQSRWEQADKVIVLFLPVILLVLDALVLRFIYDIFRYDRRLSRVLSWVLSIFNLLTIVAIGQIYSLI
jgi:hypothetical protein